MQAKDEAAPAGWLLVDRGMVADPFFSGPDEWGAWLWLLTEASWKPREKRVGKYVVNLGRGELCHSIRFMAEAWGWSKDRTARFLQRLEDNDSIVRRNRDSSATTTATAPTVITICNYSKYQAKPKDFATVDEAGARQQRDSSATNENNDAITGNTPVGADAPPTPLKKRMWDAALDALRPGGMTDKQARAFVGKLAGDFGERAVFLAAAGMLTDPPADPKSYIRAAAQRISGKPAATAVAATAAPTSWDDRFRSAPADIQETMFARRELNIREADSLPRNWREQMPKGWQDKFRALVA